MTEFVRFNSRFEYTDPETKARTRYPAGWAGELDGKIASAARTAGVLPGGAETDEADASMDLDKMSKDELVAEAGKRGVEVKPSDTKAEILKAIEGK